MCRGSLEWTFQDLVLGCVLTIGPPVKSKSLYLSAHYVVLLVLPVLLQFNALTICPFRLGYDPNPVFKVPSKTISPKKVVRKLV